MKEWYNKLEPRERKLLLIGAGVLFVAFIYFMLWKPIVKKVDRLQTSTTEQKALVEWMKSTAVEIKQLRATMQPSAAIGQGQSLLGVIDRTASAQKLSPMVKRVKPEGETKARVWLEGAPFNEIIRWVEQLQKRQGITVVNAIVDKTKEPGKVDANILFDSASS